MIDFQYGGLEAQVFEAIAKLCSLNGSDEFPRFITSQYKDGKWKCEINVPGIKFPTNGFGETEVESINRCASVLLFHLKKHHNKDQYDPDCEESIFEGNIDQFFDKVKYDSKYRYHLCETDFLVEPELAKGLFLQYGRRTLKLLQKEHEEIDQFSQIMTIRLLVKEKKKNYC